MLAILTALGGLLGSFLPEVVKYFKDKADKAHELKIMEMQIEAQKAAGTQRLSEINVNADVAETAALYQFANPKEGWTEGLNALIRPLVTILFVVGYLYSKWPHLTWSETDQALLSGILGFWFGNRSIKAYLGSGATRVSSPFQKPK